LFQYRAVFSGAEWRTQILIHTTILTLFLTKVPKIYDGEKTASSADVAGKRDYPSVRN
jgi:hypothetical protein